MLLIQVQAATALVAIDDIFINDSEKTSTPYTFTCTSSGYSADITITDSAGTTVSIPSVTTNGTVDISTLADGAFIRNSNRFKIVQTL